MRCVAFGSGGGGLWVGRHARGGWGTPRWDGRGGIGVCQGGGGGHPATARVLAFGRASYHNDHAVAMMTIP